MKIFNEFLNEAIIQIETLMEFLLNHLISIEGIVGMMFFTFLMGLISRIRH